MANGNGQVVISRKFITWLIGIFASLTAIILGLFIVCDRMEAQAAKSFDQRFDKRFSIVNVPYANTLNTVQQRLMTVDSKVGNLCLAVKVLLMARRQEMSWEQKKTIVEELVKNDSISYDSAYAILDLPLPQTQRGLSSHR